MKVSSMDDLFVHELRDLYNAEKQLVKALPGMVKAAFSPELKECLQDHLQETRHQVDRLEEIFNQIDESPGRVKCRAMEGLIDESEEICDHTEEDHVRDAAIIGAAQRVEHYEIAGYGTARTYAEQLGNEMAARLLEQSLNEEKKADQRLNGLALNRINRQALEMAAS